MFLELFLGGNMNIDDLKEILTLLNKYNFSKFEMNYEGNFIKVERKASNEISVDKELINKEKINSKSKIDKSSNEKIEVIKSPIVGVFYNYKELDSNPYVQVGDKVKKGQVIGVIEAMKIMNEIKSNHDGEILEICVPNKGIVEFGEPIIKLKLK